MRLLDHLFVVRDPDAVVGWLVRTAQNEAIRVLIRRKRTGPLDLSLQLEELVSPDETPDVDRDAERAELARPSLSASLRELTDRERVLVELMRDEPDLSYAEISGRLAIPIGSIGPTRQRGLAKLRESLELEGISRESDDHTG